MRRISPTICAVLLVGAFCAPVFAAESASAGVCPPAGTVPAAPAPLDVPADIVLTSLYSLAHC